MKNITKISIMSGLVLAGMALGGVHIANAQTTIDSGYTITIPSEVNIDKDSGKGSFSVTGKVKAQSTIDVSIQSKNGYKLKNKSKELPYSIDKKSFSFDNSKSASDLNINEVFNISSDTNTNFSGSYEDSLMFDITGNEYKYRLDINGNLDANGIGDGRLDNFGRFDVYLNGKLAVENVEDYCVCLPYGTVWELKNIRALDGYRYKEDPTIKTKGVIGQSIEYEGHLNGVNDNLSVYRISYANLQYYTNKLTINYHADGAQTWYHFDGVTHDVSGKDIAASETHLFGSYYDKKSGLGDVSRLTKKRYTAKPNTWVVGKNGTKEVIDTTGLAKSQDVAEYCGVLDEFKKNDTTIDLYPIWTPNTYTLTYDLNGGSFNASTTQRFKYESEDAISSEIPIKSGYSFAGWKWGDVTMQPGDTIPKGWGNFTLTAQWEKAYSVGTVLNIEGTEYTVIEQKENNKYLVMMNKSIGNLRILQSGSRSDGQNVNTYEGSTIDEYLENDWYNGLPSSLKAAILPINIKQASYATKNDSNSKQEAGPNGQIYNEINRHVYLPSVDDIGKVVDLKNPDKVKSFLNKTSIWTRDSFQSIAFYMEYLDAYSGSLDYNSVGYFYGVRPAFVIDLSKIDATVVDTVNYK